MLVPLIIAVALFMQSLDATILTTSIPTIARSLGEPTLRLHLAITSYMLALAAFLPLGGWLADRFGARRIFRVAIFIFTAASVLCGFAGNLPMLLVARVLQGLGGAMMVPVGRLILVRSVEKSELVKALTLMALPALLGPVVGPPLGGLITTVAAWPWIFWVNLPIGLAGFILAGIFIVRDEPLGAMPFDVRGFLLSGLGLSITFFGFDAATTSSLPPAPAIAALAFGIAVLALYALHARRMPHPILDLRVLRVHTLRASVVGGSILRVGTDAIPFLMPLLMQIGFGYSPLQSGLITFATSAGAFGMRGFSARVLRRFGFRRVIIGSTCLASLSIAACALFRPSTPVIVILAVLAAGGIFRALAFGSVNALAFADVDIRQMNAATSFSFMAQRLSDAMSVAFSAFLLYAFSAGAAHIPLGAFGGTLVITAAVSILAVAIFYRLPPEAGASLSGHGGKPPP